MSLLQTLISSGGTAVAADLAGAVDFDGTNDYLSRSSDLVGNADGKAATVSGWIYRTVGQSSVIYQSGAGANFLIRLVSAGQIIITAKNASGTNILTAIVSDVIPISTFSSFQISFDLTSTSRRSIYINDTLASVSWTTYSNDSIRFSNSFHSVAASPSGGDSFTGRLSHVFLDYTYRDLTQSSNRRLFTTIDPERGLVPARDQAPLNPIIYMPLTDPMTAHINEGTGGNFTLNGVIARSGREPNQYNAAASEFDGSSDALQGSVSGLSSSRTVLLSFAIRSTNPSTIFQNGTAGSSQTTIFYNGGQDYSLNCRDSGSNIRLRVLFPGYVPGKTTSIQISFDTADASRRKCIINGVEQDDSVFEIFTLNHLCFFSSTDDFNIARNELGGFSDASIGDFYFDTPSSYIDLSANNPFYDSETGKPRYLGATGQLPTGSQPLVYLPLRADNAGNNLGSGGDFTVNSGPFTGARGPGEFWARSANFASSGSFLLNNSLSRSVSSRFFSIAIAIEPDALGDKFYFDLMTSGNSSRLEVFANSGGAIRVRGRNSSGTIVLEMQKNNALSNNSWTVALIQIDMDDSANCRIYLGSDDTTSVSTHTQGQSIGIIGRASISTNSFSANASIGHLMINDSQIDFSQEANRLRFIDGLGYPIDLSPAIEEGQMVNPLIYMKFDQTDLGTNSGDGGNFSINGTVNQGGDVRG